MSETNTNGKYSGQFTPAEPEDKQTNDIAAAITAAPGGKLDGKELRLSVPAQEIQTAIEKQTVIQYLNYRFSQETQKFIISEQFALSPDAPANLFNRLHDTLITFLKANLNQILENEKSIEALNLKSIFQQENAAGAPLESLLKELLHYFVTLGLIGIVTDRDEKGSSQVYILPTTTASFNNTALAKEKTQALRKDCFNLYKENPDFQNLVILYEKKFDIKLQSRITSIPTEPLSNVDFLLLRLYARSLPQAKYRDYLLLVRHFFKNEDSFNAFYNTFNILQHMQDRDLESYISAARELISHPANNLISLDAFTVSLNESEAVAAANSKFGQNVRCLPEETSWLLQRLGSRIQQLEDLVPKNKLIADYFNVLKGIAYNELQNRHYRATKYFPEALYSSANKIVVTHDLLAKSLTYIHAELDKIFRRFRLTDTRMPPSILHRLKEPELLKLKTLQYSLQLAVNAGMEDANESVRRIHAIGHAINELPRKRSSLKPLIIMLLLISFLPGVLVSAMYSVSTGALVTVAGGVLAVLIFYLLIGGGHKGSTGKTESTSSRKAAEPASTSKRSSGKKANVDCKKIESSLRKRKEAAKADRKSHISRLWMISEKELIKLGARSPAGIHELERLGIIARVSKSFIYNEKDYIASFARSIRKLLAVDRWVQSNRQSAEKMQDLLKQLKDIERKAL